MKHKEKDDLPHNVSRFRVIKNTGDTPIFISRPDRQQVRYVSSVETDADFSFSDGANIQAVKPGNTKRPKIKTVIENTKPQT